MAACPACTFINADDANACEMCGAALGSAPPTDAAVKACAHCTLENAADASACVACGAWWCPRCTRCVPEAVACCDVCGYPESADNGAQQASPNDAVDAPVAEKAAVDADVATTPSEAEPMKVLQSIWDASAVATVARGDLRFMPFSEGVDLSKLVELRTLKGHSSYVRCGVRCTFVMIWLRRRS